MIAHVPGGPAQHAERLIPDFCNVIFGSFISFVSLWLPIMVSSQSTWDEANFLSAVIEKVILFEEYPCPWSFWERRKQHAYRVPNWTISRLPLPYQTYPPLTGQLRISGTDVYYTWTASSHMKKDYTGGYPGPQGYLEKFLPSWARSTNKFKILY